MSAKHVNFKEDFNMSKVYPLRNPVKGGNTKRPMYSYSTEEYVSKIYDFWLTSDSQNQYRLHSKQPMCWDNSLAYDVICPKCGAKLTVCGMPQNHNDLFLYECRNCITN